MSLVVERKPKTHHLKIWVSGGFGWHPETQNPIRASSGCDAAAKLVCKSSPHSQPIARILKGYTGRAVWGRSSSETPPLGRRCGGETVRIGGVSGPGGSITRNGGDSVDCLLVRLTRFPYKRGSDTWGFTVFTVLSHFSCDDA
jgi:hypothetical protein